MHETAASLPPGARIHRSTCPHCGEAIAMGVQSLRPRIVQPARQGACYEAPARSVSDLLSATTREIGKGRNAHRLFTLAALAAVSLLFPACTTLPQPSALEGDVAPDGAYRLRVEFDSAARKLPLCQGGAAK